MNKFKKNIIMSEDQLFNSVLETKSVSTIITDCNNNKIDLNAKYQRDVVWKTDKKSAFINSVFKGIIPNNIILNLDLENNKNICVDGKQRITSLLEFSKNLFPFEWENEFLYYNKVPKDYEKNKSYREMTIQELSKFENRTIPVAKYVGLHYQHQVDVFNRIQNGMALSAGELAVSVIDNDKICDIFKKFCDEQKHILTKYVKTGKDRQGHVLLLTYLLYLLESNDQKIPNSKDREKFLKSINTPSKMTKTLNKLQSKLQVYFSKDLFNNSDFTQYIQKINQNLFFSLILAHAMMNIL